MSQDAVNELVAFLAMSMREDAERAGRGEQPLAYEDQRRDLRQLKAISEPAYYKFVADNQAMMRLLGHIA